MRVRPGNSMLHCNVCLGQRRHTILHEVRKDHHEPEDDESSGYEEHARYLLAECNGCENVSLHVEHWSSGNPDISLSQWPPKVSRAKPKWFFNLILQDFLEIPYKSEFLEEIYVALSNQNLRLAVIGIRALLEQIMIESVGDAGSFKANLAAFEREGFISRVQKEAIEPVIEAGHASMHRGFKASRIDVEALMDVVENLIEAIYISKHRVEKIKIPERKT